jgi:hypothetical protein
MRSVAQAAGAASRARWHTALARGAAAVGCALCLSRCSLADFDGLSSGLEPVDTLDNSTLLGAAGAAGLATDPSGGMASDAGESGASGDGGSTAVSTGPRNLIVNPSFDGGASRWAAVGSCSVTLSTDSPRSGSACLLVSNRTESWQGPGYNLVGVAAPATSYTAKVWARTAQGSATMTLTYKHRCADDAADPTYSPLGSNLVSSEWTELTASLTVPDCTLSDSLLYVEGPAAGTDFYIDDASLTALGP